MIQKGRRRVEMKTYTDKRSCARHSHTAPISFSYFNKEYSYEAQTLNFCDEGMRFKSEVLLQPGATVYIRVKKFHPDGFSNGDCRGLRSASLAEVKWCKEVINENRPLYEIGAKYYEPAY
jgi:hypothetical protein